MPYICYKELLPIISLTSILSLIITNPSEGSVARWGDQILIFLYFLICLLVICTVLSDHHVIHHILFFSVRE